MKKCTFGSDRTITSAEPIPSKKPADPYYDAFYDDDGKITKAGLAEAAKGCAILHKRWTRPGAGLGKPYTDDGR